MSTLYNWSMKLLNSKKDKIKKHVKEHGTIGFVVLGDSHISSTDKDSQNHYILNSNGIKYKKILNHIVNNKEINPLFIIHGGDTVDKGEDSFSFKAFVNTTKEVLERKKLPMFVSIGNHDYNFKNKSSENFRHYIGPICKCINIPGVHLKLILLNICYSKSKTNCNKTYFSNIAIDTLKNESKISPNPNSYIIDFHSPLQISSSRKISDYRGLSKEQTNEFFKNIEKLNVCGIFCHHRHTSYTMYINKSNMPRKINYTVSGCGGNHRKNKNFSYYYVTIDTCNYEMTCREIVVS